MDVPEPTIEAEDDLDYTYSYDYTFGILTVSTPALASATTDATTEAIGTGSITSTADPQTTASTTTTSAGAATATATATATASTDVPDGTLVDPTVVPVQYQITRDGTDIEDTVYDVDPLVDTANPFGDYAVIKIDDQAGEKFEEYRRGTRIDIAVSEDFGITFENRFTGYVVERRELDQQGADALEVEAYSFDQFLRRNTVTNDQTGNTISEAFEDIITTDTPVSYNASKVDVGDDQTLTRGYQGEPVENVLRDFAFKSVNEEFGVDDALDAFFRPRETEHIDRGIDNTQWFNYDIPELGKETINEVEVWFDNGNESVIVDDGTDKLDLQDNLGLPSPGTQRAELNRPLITDISDAEDEGRKYLTFRNSTLSGTVTTFGLYDAEPGDTIDITIEPRGVDEEFVIAATKYRWGVDETLLTIVEKRGDVDDILTELNDSVQRQEMEGADRDAPKNRITTTNARGIISTEWDVDGTLADDDRLANAGRNSIRDGWINDGNPDIAEIRVGDSNAGLSRSNTSLESQANTASVSESLPTTTSVTYTASITQTDVSEVGLFESDGTLITRATLETPIDVAGDISVTLDVSNDDSVSRGVLTTGGQTAFRDIIADNTPDIPDEYGYGSDGSAVSESDTSLGNELVRVGLQEISVQSADTNTEWSGITTLAASDPLVVQNDRLELTQTGWTTESSDLTRSGTNLIQDTVYSNDEAEQIDSDGDTLSVSFTTDHTIPGEDFEIWVRVDSVNQGPSIQVTVDVDGSSQSWEPVSSGAGFGSLDWRDFANDTFGGSGAYDDSDIPAGSTVTVTLEGTSAGDGHNIDVLSPLDGRFSYTFDNDTDGAGLRVSGPELYPSQFVTSLATAPTRRLINEARFASTWNDISNNQYVEIANDGTNFTRFNNADSGSTTFASQDEDLDTNLAFSRFGSDSNATPTDGRQGQYIDTWELFATVEAVATDDIGESLTRAIVPPDTIAGETVRECGIFGDDTLLTRHELAEFVLLANQRLASSETTRIIGDTT